MGVVKPINELSKGAFTVYLLHITFFPLIDIERFVSGSWLVMLGHILVSTIGIYIACWCVYKVYEFVSRPIWRIAQTRIPLLTRDIYEGL